MFKTWNYDVDAFDFVPVVSISFIIFIVSLAVFTLPFMVITEVMPEKLKDVGLTFCMLMMWFCAFVVVKFFPLLIETLGLHGASFCFAGWCLVSVLYIIFCMPETKGKSYDEIMDLLGR